MASRRDQLISGGQERSREAPQDIKKCGVGCYVWGKKVPIMIDILVLGNSLRRHGTKADMFLCMNDDTRRCRLSNLFKLFWRPVPVKRVALPPHLQGSELERLQGVYFKLQTLKVFAESPYDLEKFLLMDGNMLVRTNIDELFTTKTPAAVMSGDCDTCQYERTLSESYCYGGSERSFTHDKQKMEGGIDGGLLLFEPSVKTYGEMYESLKKFRPNTTMADREFLSDHWGLDAEVWAMHKRNNFQLHQLYLTLPTLPPDQTGESVVKYMIEHPEKSRCFISVRT